MCRRLFCQGSFNQRLLWKRFFSILPEKKQSEIPGVTHCDGTGRLQTVSREQNPLFADVINAFRSITGVPVVLNTSFNLKGEAIVCSPEDAVRTFYSSGLDALVIGKLHDKEINLSERRRMLEELASWCIVGLGIEKQHIRVILQMTNSTVVAVPIRILKN